MDDLIPRWEAALAHVLSERDIPVGELAVVLDDWSDKPTIQARCTEDPLLHPPPSANGAAGPWDHRRILVEVTWTTSDETERPCLLVTMITEIAASHAHYTPSPANVQRATRSADDTPVVRVTCNWEYDAQTMTPGCCELRDNDHLHYLTLRPPHWLDMFAQACAEAAEMIGRDD